MNQKLCLITGGGSGIGRATAIKFAQNKINLKSFSKKCQGHRA